MAKAKSGDGKKWWLQLQFIFFSDKRVRALRRKYGDLSLIIYQKIMLKSLQNHCCMKFENLEDTFEEEIAVDIVEDEPGKIPLIKNILDFLMAHELMIKQDDGYYFFPQAEEMSGGESASAERMRRKRARDKESQSDINTSHIKSQSDREKSQDDKTCDDKSVTFEGNITEQNITDIHLKSDNSKTLDDISKTETEQADADFVSVDRQAVSAAAETAEPPAGDLFSLKQLIATVKRNKVKLTEEGVQIFLEEMQESGWILYNEPVEKRLIVRALRGWAKHHPEYQPDQENEPEKKDKIPVR